jgi:hypothetical protein
LFVLRRRWRRRLPTQRLVLPPFRRLLFHIGDVTCNRQHGLAYAVGENAPPPFFAPARQVESSGQSVSVQNKNTSQNRRIRRAFSRLPAAPPPLLQVKNNATCAASIRAVPDFTFEAWPAAGVANFTQEAAEVLGGASAATVGPI